VPNNIKNVATVIFICLAKISFSFQDTTIIKRDTLQEKTIQFAPNFSSEKVKSLGNYVGVVDDSLSFQFSSGISVLNTLRGRVPSTGISVEAPFASVKENAIYVIDGILYRQSSSNFYNMNAFDYTSITVLNRGNAASVYGVYGGNGVFVLKSKTGENHLKPTIEFNAYTTAATANDGTTSSIVPPSGFGRANSYRQSYISHAIAYMQDFGKVDTRVSYNFILPVSNSTNHNIKINTGFDLHPKFKARLIVDNLYNTYHDKSSSSSTWISDSSNYQIVDSVIYYVYDSVVVSNRVEKSNRSYLQGSLILQYYPTDWLTLSSQSSLGKVNELVEQTENLDSYKRRDNQNRSLINFFATVNTRVGSSFTFSPFAGFQYEFWDQEIGGNSNYVYYSRQDKYCLTGVNVSINDFLFGHFDYRKDLSSVISNKQRATHSTSLSFIFSDAFGWTCAAFPFGKLRTSIGRIYEDKNENNSYLVRIPENVLEVGTDLKFANNRIGFTFNYFNEKEVNRNQSINPTSGYHVITIYNGNLREKGSEVIINAIPFRSKGLEYQATLLWGRSKTTVENGYSGNVGTFITNPVPNWISSILNQVTWKNFTLSFLIDGRKGGTFHSLNGWGPYPNYVNLDATQMKLRDLSIGYQFPKSLLKHIRIRQAFVSTSARNMLLLYSKSGQDVEESFGLAQKTTSLNLNLLF
jgi:hypothetical protein